MEKYAREDLKVDRSEAFKEFVEVFIKFRKLTARSGPVRKRQYAPHSPLRQCKVEAVHVEATTLDGVLVDELCVHPIQTLALKDIL